MIRLVHCVRIAEICAILPDRCVCGSLFMFFIWGRTKVSWLAHYAIQQVSQSYRLGRVGGPTTLGGGLPSTPSERAIYSR